MPDMVDRPDIVRDNPNVPKYHSNFELKEVRLTTEQFGLIKPHVVLDDVSSDDFEYRPQYRTKSYTLKAPLMQDVHRKLSYVKVDLSAILPNNYEKFYTNPVIGDDVPNDCGTVVEGGFKKIADAFDEVFDSAERALQGLDEFTTAHLTAYLKALIFGELFYSRGNLLHSLGCHISKQFYAMVDNVGILSYDKMFDAICSKIIDYLVNTSNVNSFNVRIGSKNYIVVLDGSVDQYVGSPAPITFRDFLNAIRETADWEVTSFPNENDPTSLPNDFNFIVARFYQVSDDVPFNFGRLCAYQLAIAEYFTNDKIDHVYSAELYRQYVGSLIRSWRTFLGASAVATFTINGSYSYEYDYFSGNYLASFLNNLANSASVFITPCFEYFISLFGLKRSLRYKDYFVSSRVRPLAVGDVSVSVDNNAVSVIDVSRKIQVQRFLNAVNHTGRRLSNYIKTFFGIDIAPDRHVPHWLADIDEMVYTAEVENTGEAQQTNPNSVTAVFTGNSGNMQLHFYADLPGYIIGLTSYDIERAYPDTINRSFFIEDRFDMFIPELQFVGDQPVLSHELDSSDNRAFGTAFGYQYRDMQYKLFYAVADGGFVENLPGYGFLYKPAQYNVTNISPDFIRSKVSELDEFYLSLTGYSLGSYFHFISVITNNISAKRPMIANPKILE